MKCRDKQYSVGEEYTEEVAILCTKGIHFCKYPLDCFNYYSPSGARFCEVEAPDEAVSEATESDSKRVTTKIKIVTELSIRAITEAAIKFTFERATHGGKNATGYQSAASATGTQGAASATGTRGAASATGTLGAASAENSTAVALASGYKGRAKGVIGSALFLAERNDDGEIVHVAAVIVDGKTVEEGVYYTLCDGKIAKI